VYHVLTLKQPRVLGVDEPESSTYAVKKCKPLPNSYTKLTKDILLHFPDLLELAWKARCHYRSQCLLVHPYVTPTRKKFYADAAHTFALAGTALAVSDDMPDHQKMLVFVRAPYTILI